MTNTKKSKLLSPNVFHLDFDMQGLKRCPSQNNQGVSVISQGQIQGHRHETFRFWFIRTKVLSLRWQSYVTKELYNYLFGLFSSCVSIHKDTRGLKSQYYFFPQRRLSNVIPNFHGLCIITKFLLEMNLTRTGLLKLCKSLGVFPTIFHKIWSRQHPRTLKIGRQSISCSTKNGSLKTKWYELISLSKQWEKSNLWETSQIYIAFKGSWQKSYWKM